MKAFFSFLGDVFATPYFFLYALAIRSLLSLLCLWVLQVLGIFDVLVHIRISMTSEKTEVRSLGLFFLLSNGGTNTNFSQQEGRG